ncbi:nucleotidyltransferase domain-containing protein [Bordetella flabilis]|uniref:Nucleotidyltransferase-like domain-containing protein n=1 Tax=Bordetella flabilis TaxID=463014 RepID=A0A193GN07_9BORD|nr:nucleotidyltransferase domain-containing protein [Bordetella flabilis]ANN80881.1 hypothetical protein BAU07_26535 [Bordetella flabilis]
MQFVELEDEQRLNFVNSEQLYRAWREARESLLQYRYGMRWVDRNGKRYLVRFIDAKGNGRSLGPESAKTHEVLKNFDAGRIQAREKYDGLSQRLLTQIRLNRALRLGRVPRQAAEILSAMNVSGLDREFLVVGTHALFAYEAMAAVHVHPGALASDDLDLCFDARRPLQLVSDKLKRHDAEGLLGFLQSVDKTYAPMKAKGVFRAVNATGFMVDLITPERSMRHADAVTFGAEDLVAAEVPNLHWLINAPKVQQVAIASNGRPVMMQVPDPRAFALHKAWLSQQPTREPVKRQRDKGQAMIAVAIVGQYLPHLPFSPDQLRYLSLDMLHLATNAIAPESEDDILKDLRDMGDDGPSP